MNKVIVNTKITRRDRSVPIRPAFEKAIYEAREIVDQDIPMKGRVYQGVARPEYIDKSGRVKDRPSNEGKRILVCKWVLEMMDKQVDIEAILGEELYTIMYLYMVENVTLKDIAAMYGVTGTTISKRLWAKGGVYNKLRYWKSRV